MKLEWCRRSHGLFWGNIQLLVQRALQSVTLLNAVSTMIRLKKKVPDIKICGLKCDDLCTSVYYISCDLHRSPNIVMTTNSRQLQQTWHAARVDVQCKAFKISIGKTLLRVLT